MLAAATCAKFSRISEWKPPCPPPSGSGTSISHTSGAPALALVPPLTPTCGAFPASASLVVHSLRVNLGETGPLSQGKAPY
jgi:hypothetical protein